MCLGVGCSLDVVKTYKCDMKNFASWKPRQNLNEHKEAESEGQGGGGVAQHTLQLNQSNKIIDNLMSKKWVLLCPACRGGDFHLSMWWKTSMGLQNPKEVISVHGFRGGGRKTLMLCTLTITH